MSGFESFGTLGRGRLQRQLARSQAQDDGCVRWLHPEARAASALGARPRFESPPSAACWTAFPSCTVSNRGKTCLPCCDMWYGSIVQ